MADTDFSTDNTTLAGMLQSQMPGMLAASQANRQKVQQAATELPTKLSDIRQKEKSDIEALGPVPQLTPEEMKAYAGKPPAPAPTSVGEEWGSPAMFLALFGSALTKMPLTNALNAGAKVMQAYQQKDFDAAKQSYDQWKNANDTAIKLFKMQSDAYSNALERIRSGTEDQRKDAIAEMTALSSAFKDPVHDFLAAGHLDQAMQMLGDRANQYAQLESGTDAATYRQKLVSDAAAARQKFATATTPEEKAAAQQELTDIEQHFAALQNSGSKAGQKLPSTAGKLSPEAISQIADQYQAGDKSALQGLGWGQVGSTNRAAVRDELARRGVSGADLAAAMAEYGGTAAGERTLGQRSANLGMALSEAKVFIPMGVEASEKVDRTEYPTLNKVIESYEQGTGDENVTRLAVATNAITNAYAQVAARGGQSTDAARAQGREILNIAFAKGQYRTAVDQMMKEINAAQQAPGMVRSELRQGLTGSPTFTTQSGGGAASVTAPKYTGKNDKGITIHSDDGEHWFNPDGSPYEAK